MVADELGLEPNALEVTQIACLKQPQPEGPAKEPWVEELWPLCHVATEA